MMMVMVVIHGIVIQRSFARRSILREGPMQTWADEKQQTEPANGGCPNCPSPHVDLLDVGEASATCCGAEDPEISQSVLHRGQQKVAFTDAFATLHGRALRPPVRQSRDSGPSLPPAPSAVRR